MDKYNYILYRKLPTYGWFIVGRHVARENNETVYVNEATVSCTRRHLAPIYVNTNHCSACVKAGHYNVPIGHALTLDLDPGKPVALKPIAAYWRKRLKIKVVKGKEYNNVFIINGVPFYSARDACEVYNVSTATIRNRCLNTNYIWVNWVLVRKAIK